MARRRFLDPAFFGSAPVNELSVPAMVTFAGLWCYADDLGRGEDDPRMIQGFVWPRRKEVTERQVARHLAEIAIQGLICRHVVGGYPIMHLPNWREHQKPSHPKPSKLPPCREHEPAEWESFANDSGGPLERFRRTSRTIPEDFA